MKKLLIVILGVLIAAAYVALEDPQIRQQLKLKTEEALPSAVTHSTVYRWRDKDGQWQVSDKPPPTGIQYETMQYHKDTNVIPSENLTGKKSN